MRAAWYEHHGSARQSLVVGDMPDPVPGDGEVRIAVAVSGVNPGDVKKRSGWQGSPMTYPRVVPHSDGAGTIDMVGPGMSTERLGQRAWCYGAQSYRPFGTAAEYVVVPETLAVPFGGPTANGDWRDLDEQASCLGIAGITAHRAVFADGPVDGLAVLVHGATGGVGSIATQLARRGGAQVLAVVEKVDQLARAQNLVAHHAFLADDPEAGRATPELGPRWCTQDRRRRLRRPHRPRCRHPRYRWSGLLLFLVRRPTRDPLLGARVQRHDAAPAWERRFPTGGQGRGGSSPHRALLNKSLRSDIAARFPLEEIA